MTNLRDRDQLLERPVTRRPVREVRPPEAPKRLKPPVPRVFRWIEWLAVVAAVAALAVGALWLIGRGGDEDVVPFLAEHGEFTAMAARDLSAVDLESRLAGLDAEFDRDVVGWPEFTPFPDSYARNIGCGYAVPGAGCVWTGVELRVQRFAGLDANLDPDVPGVGEEGYWWRYLNQSVPMP